MTRKRSAHLIAHFERLRSNARAQPSHPLFRRHALRALALHERLQHAHRALALALATGQAAPACVQGRHALAVGAAQEHGQAIGHHDGAGQAGLRGPAAVGLSTIGAAGVQRQHLGAVHLVQKHRSHAQRLLHLRAVGGHGLGQVAHVLAQVQGVVGRRRNATCAARAKRVHLGGRRPLGTQPICRPRGRCAAA